MNPTTDPAADNSGPQQQPYPASGPNNAQAYFQPTQQPTLATSRPAAPSFASGSNAPAELPVQAQAFEQPEQPNQPSQSSQPLQPQQAYDYVRPADTQAPQAAPDPFQQPQPQARPFEQPAYVAPNTAAQFYSAPDAPNAYGSGYEPLAPTKKRRRPLLIAAFVVLALLLLAAGWYFLFYVPNKPNNVFSTGLNRTGKVVDKLVASASDKKELATVQNSDISGKIEVTGPERTYNGSFSSRFDKNQSDSTVAYKQDAFGVASSVDDDFKAEILTDLADGKEFPDVYFKLTGLNGLGLKEMGFDPAPYDGKWISLTSDYLSSIFPATATAATKQDDLTSDDVAALAKIVGNTTREYMFTADPAKAVLQQREFKGTEKIEGGITANRYVVGLNKTNTKAYCKQLITDLMAADAYKRIPGVSTDTIDTDKKRAIEDCDKSIDETKDSDTFDMWVDKKHKLISKIRFVDQENTKSYVDIGQSFTKGNKIPLYMIVHEDGDEDYDAKLTLDVDMDTNTTVGALTATSSGTEKWTVAASMTFKPYKGDVTITKPKDAIPAKTLFDAIGLDPQGLINSYDGSTSSDDGSAQLSIEEKSDDVTRINRLKSIQSSLEAYYANSGNYPTLAQINSEAWRAKNMKSLEKVSLIDPAGVKAELATNPVYGQLGYIPSSCKASGCQTYVLEAFLNTGETRRYESLN